MARRIIYFDLLTIFACLAVVFLHCNTLVHQFEPTPQWNQALAVEVLFFWAVPIFFMLTGANNMGYRSKYSTKTFLARRMKKLVIPYLFWSAVLYCYQAIRSETGLSFDGFIAGLLTDGIEAIYWFFPAIISLTLAMPVLSLLLPHRKLMWYVVGLSLLKFLAPYVCDVFGLPWTGSFNFPVAAGYVTYAILGYLLATTEVSRNAVIAICLGAVACFAIRYGYTFSASYEIGNVDRTLFDYNSVFAALPATAVFVLFKCAFRKWEKIGMRGGELISSVAGCCFGVYLIHKMIITSVFIELLGMTYQSFWLRFVCPFVVFALACGLVYCIKKIPVVKNIVP